MSTNFSMFIVGAAALAGLSLYAPQAHASSLKDCGNVFVKSDASCEVLVEGGCVAQCKPAAFTAVCAVEGALGCKGNCNLDANVECTTNCQGTCEADCNVNPAAFDCRASCEGNCAADCSGRCSASSNRAECESSCEATCSLECDANCDLQPGEADCAAQCNGCCGGECQAQINMDCQIACQSDLYVDCKADLQGGCETQCSKPEGALFCDGQYIRANNLDSCVAALRDLLDIDVQFQASASASATLSCSVEDEPLRGGAALLGFGLLCLVGLRRR
jgi:MYXO-CTERM domain-containing protein